MNHKDVEPGSCFNHTTSSRIAELRSRVKGSRRFIADKSKPIEHRLAEKRALKSWLKSLSDLGFSEAA